MKDRINIHLEASSVNVEKLAGLAPGEPSSVIRQRVEAARTIQQTRFAPVSKPNILVNGDTGPAEVQRFCQLNNEGLAMIRLAAERMGLSARAYHRVIEVGPHDCRFGGV